MYLNLAIIIDVIMVGKNVKNKVVNNLPIEQLQSEFNSKLFFDNKIDEVFIDSKYTESEIMNHILENE